jgi:hypothetical protein
MNTALTAHNAVNLLPTSVPARYWAQDGKLLFGEYLKLWEDWPRLPSDYALIPVLLIEYSAGAPPDEGISQQLSELGLESRQKLRGTILPPMSPVEHNDFKDWIRHDKVRPQFASPEKAVERSDEMHSQTFPTHMYPLAEEHLPKFLERL